MATGDGSPKWPGPVTVNDEDPKGFLTIFLTLPKMKVKGLFDKKPKNADISVDFKSECVSAQATVTDKEGKVQKYSYQKSLPEDIDGKKSSWKVKEEMLVLSLAKSEPGSWGQHANHFIKRE